MASMMGGLVRARAQRACRSVWRVGKGGGGGREEEEEEERRRKRRKREEGGEERFRPRSLPQANFEAVF